MKIVNPAQRAHRVLGYKRLRQRNIDAFDKREAACTPSDDFVRTFLADTHNGEHLARFWGKPITGLAMWALGDGLVPYDERDPFIHMAGKYFVPPEYRGPQFDDSDNSDGIMRPVRALDAVLLYPLVTAPLAVALTQATGLLSTVPKAAFSALGAGIGAAIGVVHGAHRHHVMKRKIAAGDLLRTWLVSPNNDVLHDHPSRIAKALRVSDDAVHASLPLLQSDDIGLHQARIIGSVERSLCNKDEFAGYVCAMALETMPALERVYWTRYAANLREAHLDEFAGYLGDLSSWSDALHAQTLVALRRTHPHERTRHLRQLWRAERTRLLSQEGAQDVLEATSMARNLANGEAAADGVTPSPYAVDPENVMRMGRHGRCDAAIAWLVEHFPEPTRADDFLAQMRSILREPSAQMETFFDQVRGVRFERNNFKDALFRRYRSFDFTLPIGANPGHGYRGASIGLALLAAKVMRAVLAYNNTEHPENTPADREAMRYGLVVAISHCIEEDGHRVCSVGIAQRLLTVLQGYYPQVVIDAPDASTLLTSLAAEFDARFEDGEVPRASEVLRFVGSASRASRDELPAREDQVRFDEALREYVALQYGYRGEAA